MTSRLDPPSTYDAEQRTIWDDTINHLTAGGRIFQTDPASSTPTGKPPAPPVIRPRPRPAKTGRMMWPGRRCTAVTPRPNRKEVRPVGKRLTIQRDDRFGRGTVVDPEAGTNRHGHRLIRLRCDDGTDYIAELGNLRNGHTQSCGCLSRETSAELAATLSRSHGLSCDPLYQVWLDMRHRCENPARRAYGNYGGRGITIWEPWHDPARFIADITAEIGPRPPGTHPSGWALWSINRIDNDGPYEPGNVEWADDVTQARNSRRNGLTPEQRATRNRQVLDLRATGCTYQQIADSLSLTFETVRNIIKPDRRARPQ